MYDKEFCRKRNRKSIQPNFFEEVTADNTAYSIAEIDDDRQCKMFGGSESSASESLGIAHGDREGQYSIRINIQYRICFNVDGDDFFNVEIVDYHS